MFGVEDWIEHYVELSEDPKGDLPSEFSICNSVLIKYVTTHQYFYQLYNVGTELVSAGFKVNIVERGRALVQSDVASQPRQGRDD